MTNFTVTQWNQTLAQFEFQNPDEEDLVDINALAKDLSEKINAALDIIAPKKVFTIRPHYVQGLSENVKNLMKDRDQTRSQLRYLHEVV